VRKIQVPEEISKPIREAEIANQELLRNQQEKLRADGAAEKMEAETKINQRKQQIEAETAKKVAETQAQQRLAVADSPGPVFAQDLLRGLHD
jgi:regulator of protease activity HflC (stomatin/prohibitin superfamily)